METYMSGGLSGKQCLIDDDIDDDNDNNNDIQIL